MHRAQAAAAWLQTIVVHPAEQVCNAAGICFGSPAVLAFVPKPPSSAHWLGTTVFAQDVWSQLLASTRATLLVGFIAGAIATALSVLVGVTAGYLGGNADEGLSLLSNVFLAIPGLPLLIVLASYVPSAGANVIIIALIVAVTGWAYGARVLRAQTLSLRNRDFVEAARVSGEGRFRIIVVEVLPNLLPIVASTFLFTTLYAVGAYVALAFLGLAGAPNATPAGLWNWGEMLKQAYPQNAVASGWWWWWLPPGFCIALLGMGLALLNFGIDEFVNPRLRAAGLSRRSARRAGISFRPRLGITPVMRRRATGEPQAAAAVAAPEAGRAKGRRHDRARAPAGTPSGPRTPPQLADPVLEIQGLCVDYGYGDDAVSAVVDCDLVLRRGEVMGLAGESGSGKSTLAMAALRLLRSPGVITAGEVLFHSKPFSDDGPRGTIDMLAADETVLRAVRWSEISVVLQSALNALNPVITIGAQFDDVLHVHRPSFSSSGPMESIRRAARDGGHDAGPAAQLPARAVRRHAPAGDDRDGARARAAGDPARRADHRARRRHPARDPRGADGVARPARVCGALHHPRPLAPRRAGRRDRRHVRGQPDGARPRGEPLPRTTPAVHVRPAQLLPADARRAPADGRHPRIAAEPPDAPDRVRLPPALPLGDGPVQGDTHAPARRWTGRDVACWLHAGRDDPQELALPTAGDRHGGPPGPARAARTRR